MRKYFLLLFITISSFCYAQELKWFPPIQRSLPLKQTYSYLLLEGCTFNSYYSEQEILGVLTFYNMRPVEYTASVEEVVRSGMEQHHYLENCNPKGERCNHHWMVIEPDNRKIFERIHVVVEHRGYDEDFIVVFGGGPSYKDLGSYLDTH